jgi:class 3 adenylate cyclase
MGKSYAFREYFREAKQGKVFISNLVIGSTTGRSGIYIANPIYNKNTKEIDAVIVIKLKGEAVQAIVNEMSIGQGSEIFLVDHQGIIISHSDPKWLYYSLVAIQLAPSIIKKRFRRFDSIKSLKQRELSQAVLGSKESGNIFYHNPDQSEHVAGYAPLKYQDWTVVISKPYQKFAEPLNQLIERTLFISVLIAFLIVFLAWIFARLLIRPIKSLLVAAQHIENHSIEQAQITVSSHDELGHLQSTFNQMRKSLIERERERDIFGRVVSPVVREQLLQGSLQLGGEAKRVTILFSDIRGFTTLSEKLTPQEVVTILNEYLEAMTEAIRPYGGYINNFIGDAIIVVFGAPHNAGQNELRAVQSAVAMRQALHKFNQRRVRQNLVTLNNGIGISSGEVVAGLIGSLERLMYTVIGDAVNIAARLESLTKEHQCAILINKETEQQLQDIENLSIKSLGLSQIKGRKHRVGIFSVDENSAIL